MRAGHKGFPNTRAAMRDKLRGTFVPIVEVTCDSNAARSWCPNGERRAGSTVDTRGVCTQYFPQPVVGTFRDVISVSETLPARTTAAETKMGFPPSGGSSSTLKHTRNTLQLFQR